MYEELNNNTGSGSYYDTNGGYVHYDSQSQMNQPRLKVQRLRCLKKEKRRVWQDRCQMHGTGARIRKCIQRGIYGNQLYRETDVWGCGGCRRSRGEQSRRGNAYNGRSEQQFGCIRRIGYRSELYAVGGVHYQYGNDGVSDIFRYL